MRRGLYSENGPTADLPRRAMQSLPTVLLFTFLRKLLTSDLFVVGPQRCKAPLSRALTSDHRMTFTSG